MTVQDVYRALSDPVRRKILKLLQDGPLPAGAIAAEFSISWPSVSRHLGVLTNAGLVQHERNGQQVIYELKTSVLVDIVTELAELAAVGGRVGGTATDRLEQERTQ
jgi:ArsR family transcriptional regulator, arsenate/arsenite/antimonite-responsive transcriptional repressor